MTMNPDQTTTTPAAGQANPYGSGPAPSPVGGYQQAAVGFQVGGAPVSTAGKRLAATLLDGVLMIVTLGIGWLIWSLVVWSKGTSPGKSLLGMRCVRTDTGQVATFGTMAMRELVGKQLLGSITGGITSLVSCFMIMGSSRQGIWDKLANTVVVDDPDGRLLPA